MARSIAVSKLAVSVIGVPLGNTKTLTLSLVVEL
jgi:hypothetical protein